MRRWAFRSELAREDRREILRHQPREPLYGLDDEPVLFREGLIDGERTCNAAQQASSGTFENDIISVISYLAPNPILDRHDTARWHLRRAAAIIGLVERGRRHFLAKTPQRLGSELLDTDDGHRLTRKGRNLGLGIETVTNLDKLALGGLLPQGPTNGIIASQRRKITAQEDVALGMPHFPGDGSANRFGDRWPLAWLRLAILTATNALDALVFHQLT